MFQKIDSVLQDQGYQKIPLNVSGLYFHLFRQETNGYAVISIDETTGTFLSREQFFHISEQIREYLIRQDCRTNCFLYLLLTDQPQSAQRLFLEQDCYWIIQPSDRQLRVYENWNPFYQPLRTALEQLFPLPMEMKASSSTDSYSSQASGQTTSKKRTASRNFFSKQTVFSCTTILVLVNAVIFLLTDFMELFYHSDAWLELGAESWQAVILQHEYYRMLTSMFLHNGFDHIFNNMIVLFFIGSYLEQRIGQKRFLIIYFCSGILAGCTSMVYNMIQNTTVISVGASGAIFGLMGGLLAVVLLKKGQWADMDIRRLFFSILISLYGGFTSQGVDNAAHIGGFVGGVLITAVLCLKERRNTKTCYE